MPGVLKDFGLCAALKELISSTNDLQKTDFSFNHFDFDERIDPTIEKMLYRISQEAVNNVLKHAKADKATIQLFRSTGLITLTIEDDGVGFDPSAEEFGEQDGIGLVSIKERIASYKGELTINTGHGQGTEMIIEIPCKT